MNLQTHEQFEMMWNPSIEQQKPNYPILLNFSASWCGPCKRVDWNMICEEFPTLQIYKCDIDENSYTPGFCGVKSIPSFAILKGPKQIVGPEQMSDTAKICSWIFGAISKILAAFAKDFV